MIKNIKNKLRKNFEIAGLLFLILTLIISSLLYNSDQLLDPPKKVPFAEFRADLNEGLISDNAVSIKGDKLTFKAEDATKYSYKEESASLSDMLSSEEYEMLNIDVIPNSSFWSNLLISALPAVFILMVIMYMLKL